MRQKGWGSWGVALVLSGILGAAPAAAGSAEAQAAAIAAGATVQAAPADPAALERLLDRMSDGNYVLGKLPPGVELPLPARTEVIGSQFSPQGSDAVVYLDTVLNAAALREFYLAQSGWKQGQPGWGEEVGGFVAAEGLDAAGQPLIFYRSAPATVIHLNFSGPADAQGRRPLVVWFRKGADAVRQVSSPRQSGTRFGLPNLPTLRAPAGVTVGGGGSGSSDQDWSQSSSLRGEIKLPALHEHYAAQLKQQGWTRAGELVQERSATSLWTLPAREGQGPRELVLNLGARSGGEFSGFLLLRELNP
ncbi:hypothetical protein GCM10017783_06960 [Deinococcus piscis]|uniref:Uncharacterized protein n=1 Tax=Deinococcus piscis TaxID=394230 RepID=A0ABQ3K2B2_9DEIO|nr:hypothetical protein [Deinococcus piscis]GHF97679.1 hypothetical protein GCM10017783_06960 [Deinococcus piscis]